MPADDFATVFAALRPLFAKYEKRLAVKADTPIEYTLLTKKPSPLPQHKGQPMFFSSLRLGKASRANRRPKRTHGCGVQELAR